MLVDPYRRPADRPVPTPWEAADRDLPSGDLAVGVPLIVVGALGVFGGIVFPGCTFEAGLGTVLLVLGTCTIATEIEATARTRNR